MMSIFVVATASFTIILTPNPKQNPHKKKLFCYGGKGKFTEDHGCSYIDMTYVMNYILKLNTTMMTGRMSLSRILSIDLYSYIVGG